MTGGSKLQQGSSVDRSAEGQSEDERRRRREAKAEAKAAIQRRQSEHLERQAKLRAEKDRLSQPEEDAASRAA